jgi:hypothetical protein
MHPILEEFCDKWVWPTMPGAPGAEFRLKITREQCLKGWETLLERNIRDIEEELASNDEEWKRQHALRGYAAEGVQMSIKQMSAQLLSVDIGEQENYIDLQRMRARQIWDECKHSKLHADVLLGKGWVKNERELMDIAQANVQPLPAYFGLSMMFRTSIRSPARRRIITPRPMPASASWPTSRCATTRWWCTSTSPSATRS